MKTKEELIEAMATAIWNRRLYKALIYPRCEIIAEAALEALCGALPDALTISRNGNPMRSIDAADKYYNQLKQWGK